LIVGYLALGLWFGVEHTARNVDDTNTMHVAMAREVDSRLPADAILACHDIGAMGFFGGRRLLDLAGISSPEVLFWPRGADGQIPVSAIMAARQPPYLCVLDGWLGRLFPDGRPPAGCIGYAVLHEIYRPRNITLGGNRYLLLELTWQ
jgi:hypothetical protein